MWSLCVKSQGEVSIEICNLEDHKTWESVFLSCETSPSLSFILSFKHSVTVEILVCFSFLSIYNLIEFFQSTFPRFFTTMKERKKWTKTKKGYTILSYTSFGETWTLKTLISITKIWQLSIMSCSITLWYDNNKLKSVRSSYSKSFFFLIEDFAKFGEPTFANTLENNETLHRSSYF